MKMERNDCEFAYIKSLRGEEISPPPSPSSEMDINSIYEYQRMERNNHTSADIKSTGRGKFLPANRLETSLCLGEISPNEKARKVTINWKEIIVNLKKLKTTHDKYFENGKK